MSELNKLIQNLFVIRGATTSEGNTESNIKVAVTELIDELVVRNNIEKKDILSITFTTTKDLDACFPASIARNQSGLHSVAFLDCQQMYVPNDIKFCIRLMATVIMPENSNLNHPYLRGASKLRADRC